MLGSDTLKIELAPMTTRPRQPITIDRKRFFNVPSISSSTALSTENLSVKSQVLFTRRTFQDVLRSHSILPRQDTKSIHCVCIVFDGTLDVGVFLPEWTLAQDFQNSVSIFRCETVEKGLYG